MDWITHQVAIGNYIEAQDVAILRQFGAVLSLVTTLADLRNREKQALAELPDVFDELGRECSRAAVDELLAAVDGKRIETVELIDGPGNDIRVFHRAVDLLGDLEREAPPVLVHCHAGKARSPVVVAGYLMKSLGIDATAALDRVARRRDIYVQGALECLLDSLE